MVDGSFVDHLGYRMETVHLIGRNPGAARTSGPGEPAP